MENLHPKDLRWKDIETRGEILEYYDGPQLYLVENRFLVLKTGLPDGWIIIDPWKDVLQDFLSGRICLRTLMLLEQKGWTLEEFTDKEPIEVTICADDDILLPDFGFYATGETSLGL